MVNHCYVTPKYIKKLVRLVRKVKKMAINKQNFLNQRWFKFSTVLY